MSFTLTREHVAKLTVAAAEGNPGPLLGAIDPDVVWQVGASAEEGKGRSGVYVSPLLTTGPECGGGQRWLTVALVWVGFGRAESGELRGDDRAQLCARL